MILIIFNYRRVVNYPLVLIGIVLKSMFMHILKVRFEVSEFLLHMLKPNEIVELLARSQYIYIVGLKIRYLVVRVFFGFEIL